MQRTKDDFLDQREKEFEPSDSVLLRMKAQMEQLRPEEATILPVIDLNAIRPEQETTDMSFDGGGSVETVDLTSMLLADKIVTAIVAGHLNPLEFYVKKKLIEDAFKVASKNPDVKEMASTEVAKYGKDGAKLLGATIKAGSRATYNYSEDPVWADLDAQQKPYVDLKKQQEKLVQAAVKQGRSFEEVDKETGEVKMLAKCVSAPSTDFISVTFKKK